MTVLVTGASGLIGSHLCAKLAEEDRNIVALARSTNLLLESVTRRYPKKIRVVPCDIRDRAKVEMLVRLLQPTTVFHLAACCQPYHTDSDFINANIKGTVNLVGTLQRVGTDKFIYASSMSVYSTPPVYLPVSEHHPTQPSGIYGRSKLVGERICRLLLGTTRIAILRFASVFGVGDTARVAGLFMTASLSGEPLLVQGDGQQSSDFIYVADAVQGLLLAWRKKATGVYNIGSGQPTTIKELARTVVRATDSKSKIQMSGKTNRPFQFVSDITKARRELGYQPTPLEEGLKKYVEKLRDQG